MSKRRRAHKAYIAKIKARREALVEKLGGKCVFCGVTENLEFDHPNGRTWCCRDKARWTRIKLYEQEAERSEIRLLCRSCNGGYQPENPNESTELSDMPAPTSCEHGV